MFLKKFRKATGFLFLLTALSMAGCSREKKPALYIEEAVLTEQEEKIAQLLGADSEQCIYDFVLDDSVQTIQVNTYELIDGKWNLISGGGGQQFQDEKGRVALGFDKLEDGLRIAIQGKKDYGASSYTTEQEDEQKNRSYATSRLSDTKEITYDTEIPLVIQICTTQNTIRSFDVSSFFEPEAYEEQGHDHVYAVTILFSQKSVNDLTSPAGN